MTHEFFVLNEKLFDDIIHNRTEGGAHREK